MSKLSYDGLKTFKEKNDETYVKQADIIDVTTLEEETEVEDDDIIIKGKPETGDLVRIKASDFFAEINSALSELYYRAGDSISIGLAYFGGYVTNGSADVRFTIPINKPVENVSSVSVTGSFIIRQQGSYTHGSGSSTWVTPSSITANFRGTAVVVNLAMSSTTNATNNCPAGIETNNLTVTFS